MVRKIKVEIRENGTAVVEGYVNLVERESHVLRDKDGTFVERIKAGVFTRAIEDAKKMHDNILVLKNHNYDEKLSSVNEGAELREDTIGLHCRFETNDATLIEDAKNGKLNGWSFGFYPLAQSKHKESEDSVEKREVKCMVLKEVSVLSDYHRPAYASTISMTRENDEDSVGLSLRFADDEVSVEEHKSAKADDDIDETYKTKLEKKRKEIF